jgi:hypothetical protein
MIGGRHARPQLRVDESDRVRGDVGVAEPGRAGDLVARVLINR